MPPQKGVREPRKKVMRTSRGARPYTFFRWFTPGKAVSPCKRKKRARYRNVSSAEKPFFQGIGWQGNQSDSVALSTAIT